MKNWAKNKLHKMFFNPKGGLSLYHIDNWRNWCEVKAFFKAIKSVSKFEYLLNGLFILSVLVVCAPFGFSDKEELNDKVDDIAETMTRIHIKILNVIFWKGIWDAFLDCLDDEEKDAYKKKYPVRYEYIVKKENRFTNIYNLAIERYGFTTKQRSYLENYFSYHRRQRILNKRNKNELKRKTH